MNAVQCVAKQQAPRLMPPAAPLRRSLTQAKNVTQITNPNARPLRTSPNDELEEAGHLIWTASPLPDPAVADLLWPIVERLFHGATPLRLRAWDGSEVGPPAQPTVILRDRRALRRLLWQPCELGLARAYVAGELDVEGD